MVHSARPDKTHANDKTSQNKQNELLERRRYKPIATISVLVQFWFFFLWVQGWTDRELRGAKESLVI